MDIKMFLHMTMPLSGDPSQADINHAVALMKEHCKNVPELIKLVKSANILPQVKSALLKALGDTNG